jgi:hypothetical protein
VQRHMPPVPDNTWTRVVPVVPALAREVVPMKRFVTELAGRPLRKALQHCLLADGAWLPSVSEAWKRKLVFKIQIRPDADNEYPFARLGDSIMLRIENAPFDPVTGYSVPAELVVEQLPVLTKGHSVNILDDERFRRDGAKNPVKLLIQVIY